MTINYESHWQPHCLPKQVKHSVLQSLERKHNLSKFDDELSYEISGDNAALYIIIFFLIENFTMAIALTAASGRSMGSWWLL